MNNICLIPARGGSKRIPRKNIKDFHGKPIIAWSIIAAKSSELFDEVYVSTDDDEIAEISSRYGANIPFMRPNSISDDYAIDKDVIEAGAASLDRKVSNFAKENNLSTNYINSLDYGSIVHNALQGLTAVVLPGKQCGSTQTSMFTFTSTGANSFDTRDFLWCFSVNDTIALTSIPTLNSGGATRLYLLEDSLTNYDPNTDCEDDSDQFIYGSVQEVMWSLIPKENILIHENIFFCYLFTNIILQTCIC